MRRGRQLRKGEKEEGEKAEGWKEGRSKKGRRGGKKPREGMGFTKENRDGLVQGDGKRGRVVWSSLSEQSQTSHRQQRGWPMCHSHISAPRISRESQSSDHPRHIRIIRNSTPRDQPAELLSLSSPEVSNADHTGSTHCTPGGCVLVVSFLLCSQSPETNQILKDDSHPDIPGLKGLTTMTLHGTEVKPRTCIRTSPRPSSVPQGPSGFSSPSRGILSPLSCLLMPPAAPLWNCFLRLWKPCTADHLHYKMTTIWFSKS